MKVRDLKIALDQYDDNNLVFVQIGISTAYRIEKGQISSAKHDSNLFPILVSTHDETSCSLILKLE